MEYLKEFMDQVIEQKIESNQEFDRSNQIRVSLDRLYAAVETIINPSFREMCRAVVANEHFQNGFGSSNKHHAYKGGLVVHTAEVMTNALNIVKADFIRVNEDYIKTAIIYHDVAKFFDFVEVNGKVEKTDHYNKIYHISKSYAIFIHDCMEYKVSVKDMDGIGHLILSHHGRKEWGSAIEPQTKEAYIVHVADWLSAKCSDDCYLPTE